MQKNGLRRLKRINATPKMVRMAKDNDREMIYKNAYGWEDLVEKTQYDLLVRCQTRGDTSWYVFSSLTGSLPEN